MVHFRRSALLTVVVLLGWPAKTALPQAPTEALVTDRPDIAESSEVVGGGWFQSKETVEALVEATSDPALDPQGKPIPRVHDSPAEREDA